MITSGARWVLVVLSILLVACNDKTTNQNIQGVVATGVPLVGVAVTSTDIYGVTSNSSVTDVQGHFSLNLAGQGPWLLTVPATDADGSPVLMSSVVVRGDQGIANLNPLTSLITQRLFMAPLTSTPSGTVIAAAQLTPANVSAASQAVAAAWAPIVTAFAIPANEINDPMEFSYVADPQHDALDKAFSALQITMHTGEVVVGYDAGRSILHVPPQGPIDAPSVVSSAAIQAMLSLSNGATSTPIQHLIVVVGENNSFDTLYGGYQPKSGQAIMNLLSEGIINADGTPGPNYAQAIQNQATPASSYTLNLTRTSPYQFLPQPTTIGIVNYTTMQTAAGLPDPNFPANLPPGPFQISKYVPYVPNPGMLPTQETGDPVHRFFQMWQQTDGDNHQHDLFTWVAVNAGQGAMTKGVTAQNPGQGGELMGFYNMSTGDAPYFKSLADQYALSDNYHQSIMGGTGDNFFAIASGDVPVYQYKGSSVPDASQIENPNPQSGTADLYQGDGYNGGSYVNCSDSTQPGVAAILNRQQSLNRTSHCAPGSYYLVNNYLPPYSATGQSLPIAPSDAGYSTNSLAYPPQSMPSIADALNAKGVSWKWYTGGLDAGDVALAAQYYANLFHITVAQATPLVQGAELNILGDALLGFSSVATNAANFSHLKGLTTFYTDLASGTLPAVSYVVPMNTQSGHPGYSETAEYEAFLQQLITAVQSNSALWAHTAIVVTTDEGGGHFDSGYIQNLDFFGDGPRIPMLLVSPYARAGHVDHVYEDHASVLKFIERNWRLPALSSRSRDNLFNPEAIASNPYQPVNGPAVGDLMSMFSF